MKNSTIYEKPWQSRRLITGLIGCGMLAAEGMTHRRQRRVATPAFSNANLRALVPITFQKGSQLRDKWFQLIEEYKANGNNPPHTNFTISEDSEKRSEKEQDHGGIVLDAAMWISRATFDVIGLAGMPLFVFVNPNSYIVKGFDYNFNSIEDQSNELFNAYKDMFEVAVSQNQGIRAVVALYIPAINHFFVRPFRNVNFHRCV
jgi:hypothetical protein